MNDTATNAADLAGRVLISILFLVSGFGKIVGYAATQAYMAAMGVPSGLLPLVIALEILGGLAIVLGFRTRLVAAVLAVFTIVAGVIFHAGQADMMQQLMFQKNLAIAGGFLFLVARGAGAWSLDARRSRRGASVGSAVHARL
jgi:putative oxidoreductase